MNEVGRPMPRPTAQVEPYFEVLGADLTVKFLLQFGGAQASFANEPKGHGLVEVLIGPDKVAALATSQHPALQKRVPVANRWLAEMLAWQGYSNAAIARRLRTTDVTVRNWLKDTPR